MTLLGTLVILLGVLSGDSVFIGIGVALWFVDAAGVSE